jgi:hypothetical protein
MGDWTPNLFPGRYACESVPPREEKDILRSSFDVHNLIADNNIVVNNKRVRNKKIGIEEQPV